MQKSKFTTKGICAIGLMCALISIFSQIAFPTIVGIPFTLQVFAVVLAGIILESKYGTVAVVVYLMLGLAGVPVFAHFRGGFTCFFQPTGGFLLSFPLLAFMVGLGEKSGMKNGCRYLCYGIGVLCNLTVGAVVFGFLTQSTLSVVLPECILPFLPTTILQVIAGVVCGRRIKRSRRNWLQ